MNDMPIEGAAAAFAARYGAAPPAMQLPWNATLAGLLAHRSIRDFSGAALPAGTLEMLVAAGQSAATSSNMQAWSVVAITDAGRRARLSAVAGGQRHIEQCSVLLMFVADLSRAERLAAFQGWKAEALPYLETFLMAALDAALAAQNVVVAAQSLGLGTVYIGAMRNDPETVAAELALPQRSAVVFGLCIGPVAPGGEGAIKPRLPQSVVLHHEQYAAGTEAAEIVTYDEALSHFNAMGGRPAEGWTGRVQARLGRIAGLSGREIMRQMLQRLGLPLT